MTEELASWAEPAPNEAAIAKAHAIYTPVYGLSNRLAWRCPTGLRDLYRRHLSADHLEAGVGTGFFLDRAGSTRFNRLALADINHHCLDRAGRRLTRFKPALYEVNLLAPIRIDAPPFALSASPMCCIVCPAA